MYCVYNCGQSIGFQPQYVRTLSDDQISGEDAYEKILESNLSRLGS
jgi:hypothetical protein